jgi:catechol 2,3-dioxygenase-like lactoylglutathione lyase family enzyme
VRLIKENTSSTSRIHELTTQVASHTGRVVEIHRNLTALTEHVGVNGARRTRRSHGEVSDGDFYGDDLVFTRRTGVRPKQWRCQMAERMPPAEGIVLTHFIVSDDVERSRRFYTEVLGGTVVRLGEPTNVALANSWIVINGGGGPTDDKPTVILETPRDPDRASSFLNIRVKDIHAVYAEWSARGAQFLTPPKQHPFEIRCYIRDPDGNLIEVGQTTSRGGDWSPAHWTSSTSDGQG